MCNLLNSQGNANESNQDIISIHHTYKILNELVIPSAGKSHSHAILFGVVFFDIINIIIINY